mgnify:CR=1 FL=1
MEKKQKKNLVDPFSYIRTIAALTIFVFHTNVFSGMNGYVINVDLGDVKEVLRLLRINSNNLNQYAKRANETGSIYEADIKDLQKGHQEILARMGEILEILSSI